MPDVMAGWSAMDTDPKLARLLRCSRPSRHDRAENDGHYLPWPRDLDPLPRCPFCGASMSEVPDVVVVPRAVWDEVVGAWGMENVR